MVSRPGGNKKRDRDMATYTGREYLGCDQTHRHGPGDKWLDSVRNTLPKEEGKKRHVQICLSVILLASVP